MEINSDEDCQPPSLLVYAGVEALVHVDVGNVESLPSLGNVAGDTLANREPWREEITSMACGEGDNTTHLFKRVSYWKLIVME